jgi:hypothetical protein
MARFALTVTMPTWVRSPGPASLTDVRHDHAASINYNEYYLVRAVMIGTASASFELSADGPLGAIPAGSLPTGAAARI